MNIYTKIAIGLILIGAGFSTIGCNNSCCPPQNVIFSNIEISKDQLIDAHNDIRIKKGLKALTENQSLDTAAEKHAQEMAKNGKLSHFSKYHGKPSNRVTAEGYYYTSVGENIAYGQSTIDEVMKDWMNSAGHRRNILGQQYKEIGVGIAVGSDGRLYWCVVFGTK